MAFWYSVRFSRRKVGGAAGIGARGGGAVQLGFERGDEGRVRPLVRPRPAEGGICRAASFRTTFSQTSGWAATSSELRASRSSPPFFSSLLWQLVQYCVTNSVTVARSGRAAAEGESLGGS